MTEENINNFSYAAILAILWGVIPYSLLLLNIYLFIGYAIFWIVTMTILIILPRNIND